VAAVVCVSSAVAGELLQDFKVGYILGGTPRTIQIVELIAVVVASLVMYFPLLVLHQGDINSGGTGFGSKNLPAPQAGLMAAIAQGIVGGDMPWPLILVGVFFGLALILMRVRSPMLIASGMYLPFPTTFAIFIGGLIRWVMDRMSAKAGHNDAQKARSENVGVLAASGLIAGEAMVGLLVATVRFFDGKMPILFGEKSFVSNLFAKNGWALPDYLAEPSYLLGLAVIGLLGFILLRLPMANAGRPEDPAPPTAMM
jgi:putative OPT family oligopeptide transporter